MSETAAETERRCGISPAVVFVVTLKDRHCDDMVTVHSSEASARARVAAHQQMYASHGDSVEWTERASRGRWRFSAYDDGPSIVIETKEMDA